MADFCFPSIVSADVVPSAQILRSVCASRWLENSRENMFSFPGFALASNAVYRKYHLWKLL